MTPERLDAGLEVLLDLAIAQALADPSALGRALEEAVERCDPREVEEALLQSHLFLGYPSALNALDAWRRISGLRAPTPGDEEPGEWPLRGARICRRVYGSQYEGLRRNVERLHPELDSWMVTDGYGKVLGRPGLALERRELLIVVMLAVQGPWVERQLYSHLRGALRAGAPVPRVEAALERALERARERAPDERGLPGAGVAEVWRRVLARHRRTLETETEGEG